MRNFPAVIHRLKLKLIPRKIIAWSPKSFWAKVIKTSFETERLLFALKCRAWLCVDVTGKILKTYFPFSSTLFLYCRKLIGNSSEYNLIFTWKINRKQIQKLLSMAASCQPYNFLLCGFTMKKLFLKSFFWIF